MVQHSKTWDATAPAYGKFWQDLPGSSERKRRTISLGVCRTKSVARQRLREYLEREGVNSKEVFHQNTAPAVTFRQQADWWVVSLQTRKRRPVKPATISGWRDALHAWLLPNLGEKLLADVSNKAARELIEKMSVAGLSAKTIVNYVQVVKLVVGSAVNEEGEQVYPRKWNHDFIQLPVVCKDKQHRPTVTDADLKEILSNTKKRKHMMLFSLLAATGLRVGEASCSTYFFAAKPPQLYCGVVCSNSAHRANSLQWWRKEGVHRRDTKSKSTTKTERADFKRKGDKRSTNVAVSIGINSCGRES